MEQQLLELLKEYRKDRRKNGRKSITLKSFIQWLENKINKQKE